MRPVAVAVLAALLPTCLLIAGLACLSIYLYFKFRAFGADNTQLRAQLAPPPQPEEPPLTDEARANLRQLAMPRPEPELKSIPAPGWTPIYVLSDASSPDWKSDMTSVFHGLSAWDIEWPHIVLNEPGGDDKFGQYLEALGYQGGASTAALLKLLRNKNTRFQAAQHIAISIGLAKTSIDSDPESTLLPFSPAVQRDLKDFLEGIKGKKFSPEFSRTLANIPSQIALEHGRINIEKMENTVDLLDKLFRPVGKPEMLCPGGSYRGRAFIGHTQKDVTEALIDAVTLQMRMLGSPQQFELRWKETNETSVCQQPALYSHAGEDGVPLDEPKLWWGDGTYDVTEDGSVTFVGEKLPPEEVV
ncbi:uncharacterized protein BP5553_06557 [Venustampulla echinocandica]|uniref:Uncharacterized protein n=1 Tax=Venustampulla echinocandica TaxID=2656787 RepID=A0A370TK95_9HELO|nr:uncharacterized protein BP5553_06557 [Venustampulla echinocandica]RDL35945.1 hypothetical protein BP5553_06557 [Venustampulla echinocandica]